MEDIVFLQVPVFLKWLEQCQLQDGVKKRYDDLFTQYDCFTKANNTYHPPKAVQQHEHKHTRGAEERKSRPEKPPKDFKKVFTSYLNKLNNTNYEKILSKSRIMITPDNIKDSIITILTNCGLQSMYMSHLVRMVADLSRLTGCSRQIKDGVTACYKSFIEDKKYVYTPKKGEQDEYAEFCNMQKHKTVVINMTNTWIHIWTTYPEMLPNHIQEYIDVFVREISHELDEYHLDLFLNVIAECCKKYRKEVQLTNINWNELHANVKPSKIKFLIEKIQGQLEISV